MKDQNYIKNKEKNSSNFLVSGIQVSVSSPLTNNISARKTVSKLVSIIPSKLLSGIKFIKIGNFQHLNKRKIQASYKDNTIFVTNAQTSESDLLDDLIHEVAHSVEETHYSQIYSDKKIRAEFIQKRKKLWILLKQKGFEINLQTFLKPEYDKKIDSFFYEKIGYSVMSSLTSSLFYSPYGATSIREYFANGFEAFYMKQDVPRLKRISPQLFNKIINL